MHLVLNMLILISQNVYSCFRRYRRRHIRRFSFLLCASIGDNITSITLIRKMISVFHFTYHFFESRSYFSSRQCFTLNILITHRITTRTHRASSQVNVIKINVLKNKPGKPNYKIIEDISLSLAPGPDGNFLQIYHHVQNFLSSEHLPMYVLHI